MRCNCTLSGGEELETITITLNGREVSGRAGMTILELARESNVYIPTLCHDPNLTPIGACRICLVEDERTGALPASCVTPIAPGMIINTDSPKVQERRETIIKLMLASHPSSCLVCDKGNRCQLRQIASDMGVGEIELQRIPQLAVIEEVNPFIERDMSKCILCAKCIRADHELVVEGAIDYVHRGFSSKPATLSDRPLETSECTFCGTCVSMCPTGALMEKHWPSRKTATKSVPTTCPLCGCGCSIELEVKDNRIVRSKPSKNASVNHGTLCVKGSYGYDFVSSPDRLTKPLIRDNADFESVTWEQALDMVASRLNQIRESHGSSSLAFLGSSKCTNEENYLLQRLARGVLGTNNIDNGGRLYCASGITGLGSVVGFPGSTSLVDSLEQSEVILAAGADISISAPIVGYAVKRAVRYRGSKLILIDPRQTKLTPFAHLWLKPNVGTDAALVNGLADVLVTDGLLDDEFIASRTDNFEALSENLAEYTPEYVEQITGVPKDEVRQAARLFAEADVACIIFGSGITQHVNGTENVKALANLAMMTGNTGMRGGILALHRDCNGQGAFDMGAIPDSLPGYQLLEDAQARKRFAGQWGGDLPSTPGLSAIEMLEHAANGELKGMYIMGENPLLSFPQPDVVKKALASVDFLVVQDMFLTETAKMANVVLPASSFAEKEGTFTNFEGRVQHIHKAVEPIGDSLPDWEIILMLADRLGSPMPYSSLQQVMAEVSELVPFYQSFEEADSGGAGAYRSELNVDSTITRRLYKGRFPSGFGRFLPVQYESKAEKPKDGYPLTLMTGSTHYHAGNGSRSSRASRLIEFSPTGYVEIGEGDAKQIGVSDGDGVRVTSPYGEVNSVAKLTDALPDGMVFMPICFPTTPINQLFNIQMDTQSMAPAFKICAVKLERI